MNELIGYFDSPEQAVPAYDPGYAETPCLLCYKPLGGNPDHIRTISLMWADKFGGKSLFYRVHRACHGSISEAEQERIEGAMLDSYKEEVLL